MHCKTLQQKPRIVLSGLALVAFIATSGSLYFSLGLGLVPCRLCWYQRILMYPLVVVFGVAVLFEDTTVYRTALPLALVGLGIAVYHSVIQVLGSSVGACSVASSCTAVLYTVWGLSIPNLSAIAFALILVGLGVLYACYAREGS